MSHAAQANATNNAKSTGARRRRWDVVRDAAWTLLGPVVGEGARVAVVGAGNGDDLPLERLARRAAGVDLIDLDARAAEGARRNVPVLARRRVRTIEQDATGGAADAVIAEATRGATAAGAEVPRGALGEGTYDVVVLDLVLTQLLYPALKGTMSGKAIDAVLLRHGQRLTDGVVARAWAATRAGGAVVVLHDLLGWWDGHRQPFALDRLLALPPDQALTLAQRGSLPYGCDPWLATRRAGAHVETTRLWRWPFSPGADYAVFGLVTRRPR
jgi:16S rRNA G966 N2-methylase RsmD